ncbi:MAG: sensor histidine kinase [Wenzhouxiangellaceae bacterium]|nr:MAG: sensor histidine kinase [Wenzhouxiangellaceae bacterium]
MRHLLYEFLKPLALASYVALAAVWMGVVGWFGLPGEGYEVAAIVLLGSFSIAWLWALASNHERPGWHSAASLILLAVSALGLISLGRSGVSPILLILLATMLAARFPDARVIIPLLLVNLVFAGLMHWRWQAEWSWVMVSVAAYGAFQAFAALLLHYARQAESMAEDLRAVNAHLLATRYLLDEAARDQERLRLSRELHDIAGHKLTALKMNLRQLRRQPDLEQVPALEQASQLADELLGDIRGVVRQLRAGDGLDLARGLEQLARPFPRPRLELDIEPGLRLERADQAEAILRLVQEALTNAARHGQARRLWVSLREHETGLELKLEDDGAATLPIKPGNGLTGMRERIESLGGNVRLEPSKRGGLLISASLPGEIVA